MSHSSPLLSSCKQARCNFIDRLCRSSHEQVGCWYFFLKIRVEGLRYVQLLASGTEIGILKGTHPCLY